MEVEDVVLKGKWEDVEFYFPEEEKKLRGHREALAANSKVWERMFNGDLKESKEELSIIRRVVIEEAESEIFEIFLNFCYLRESKIEYNQLVRALMLGERYMQEEFIKVICEEIVNMVDQGKILKVLGELREQDVDIDSINSLIEYLEQSVKEQPLECLRQERLYMLLSPKIKPIIFHLFSLDVANLHEDTKLLRMVEYGSSLAMGEMEISYTYDLSGVLEPVLQYIKGENLSARGIRLLAQYNIFTKDKIIELAASIMDTNSLNIHIQPNIHKYDLSLAKLKGSLLNLGTIGEIGAWTKKGTFLQIKLHQPLALAFITLELTILNLKFSIFYSDHGEDIFLDSLHSTTFDNYQHILDSSGIIHTTYKLFIRNREKHLYWVLKNESNLCPPHLFTYDPGLALYYIS